MENLRKGGKGVGRGVGRGVRKVFGVEGWLG